ncbi:peptide/nickel transport system substrate-binding protein [Parafrankia irregularis]|uniref:Peptide/nickel transport system substrate-binding protein n=1 Tax=Parafrankia irregularis TaxID=795642 RepID=A0A0S4R1R4_9ACTN|nr:peptide/nickel transport system substrate-binding protein [Parafrankia irregularis]
MQGGEGRILMLSDPRGLDPATLGNSAPITAVLGNALYGELMTTDDTGKVVFSMAESFDTADSGGTFTLKLKSGLVFSDGTPLNAEAVKFNWDRTKDPDVGSSYIAEASMIASIEVVDDVTLKATMTSPVAAYAQAIINSSLNWIGSPAALRAGQKSFDEHPIGAGPFTLESWTRQADIRLVRNSRYWDRPKPYLERLTIRSAVDSSQRYNTIVSGGADVAVEADWVNLDKADQAGLPTDLLPLNGGNFMTLNARRAPFNDVRARQAVSAAIDLDAFNLAAFNGTEKELPEKLFNDTSPFYSDTVLHTADKEKAQRLFDELAAEGKPVNFTFTTFPTSQGRVMAENVQTQLSSFRNVKAEVKVIDFTQVAAIRTTYDFDAVISSAFFQDPEPRLLIAFDQDSSANLSGVKDAQLSQALHTGRTATTVEARKAAYETVQKRLAEVVPVVFLARTASGIIAGKDVGGIQQYGTGSLQPEELWIKK